MLPLRLRIRLAIRLQTAWQTWRGKFTPHRQRNSLARDLGNSWSALWKVYDRLLLVEDKGHTASTAKVTDDFHESCQCLNRILNAITNIPVESGIVLPPLRDWLAEFDQIDDEFGELVVDWKLKKIRVVTEPITLEEVDLGPFAIELHWNSLDTGKVSHAFDIHASKPNRSREKSEITHPHVQDRAVCIGAADQPLTKAMEQGRLCDAFVLIRSVLETYNPDSAYATLKDWHGTPCRDCGATIQENESYSCERCDSEVCIQCSSLCEVCETTHCRDCLLTCDICEHSHCSRCRVAMKDRTLCKDCMEYCSRCNTKTPKDHYDDDTELCSVCLAIQQAREDQEESDELPVDAAGETPAHI